jgi:hypothetical protein
MEPGQELRVGVVPSGRDCLMRLASFPGPLPNHTDELMQGYCDVTEPRSANLVLFAGESPNVAVKATQIRSVLLDSIVDVLKVVPRTSKWLKQLLQLLPRRSKRGVLLIVDESTKE